MDVFVIWKQRLDHNQNHKLFQSSAVIILSEPHVSNVKEIKSDRVGGLCGHRWVWPRPCCGFGGGAGRMPLIPGKDRHFHEQIDPTPVQQTPGAALVGLAVLRLCGPDGLTCSLTLEASPGLDVRSDCCNSRLLGQEEIRRLHTHRLCLGLQI